jgi:hypothetical protein
LSEIGELALSDVDLDTDSVLLTLPVAALFCTNAANRN